jgi:hypothetical protein
MGEVVRVLSPGGLLVATEEVSIRDLRHELPPSFRRSHPLGVFHLATEAERVAQVEAAGLLVEDVQPLSAWAIELVDSRRRALRLLRGTAEGIYGAAAVEAIDTTLGDTLDAYRSGAIVPAIVVASAPGR